MVTFFTTAKPCVGHNGVIQRNALKSWTLVHPDAEVILFGDDGGSADVAQELGNRHEVYTERNESGSNRVDYMFARAQAIARHSVLCYSNCDIIFTQDFRSAVERVLILHREFLMIGRRWDTAITQPLDFADPDWQRLIRNLALLTGTQRTADWIDYFVFSRGLFMDVPPLAVGRVFWDNWMVWRALAASKPVIDASRQITAVHQNHDYRHHPQDKEGVWNGTEADANHALAGGWRHLRTIEDANEVLREGRLKPNAARRWAASKRYFRQAWRFALYCVWQPVWFSLLDLTRPLRNTFGLRAAVLRRSRGKM